MSSTTTTTTRRSTKQISFLVKLNFLMVLLILSVNTVQSQSRFAACKTKCLSELSLCITTPDSAQGFKQCRIDGQKCMQGCKNAALLKALNDEMEFGYAS